MLKFVKAIPLKYAGSLSLLLLLMLFRMYQLGEIPPGLSSYEIGILKNPTGLMKPYLDALNAISAMLGVDDPKNYFVFLKSSQMWLSVISGFAIYVASRKLFGGRVALLSGFLWAIFFPALLSGRVLNGEAITYLLMSLCYLTLAYGKSKISQIIFAFLLALLALSAAGGYLYLSVLLVAAGILIAIKKIKLSDQRALYLAVPFSLLSITAAHLLSYASYKFVPLDVFRSGFFGLFIGTGPGEPAFNTPGVPVFDILTATLFVLGIFYLSTKPSLKIRTPMALVLFSGFAAGLVSEASSVLSFHFLYLPAIILAAITFDRGLSHWLRLFPLNRLAKSAGVLLASAFLFLAMLYSYNRFFVAFGYAASVRETYHEGIVEVSSRIKSYGRDAYIYSDQPTIEGINYLLSGSLNTHPLLSVEDGLENATVVVDAGVDGASVINTALKESYPKASKEEIRDEFGRVAFIIYLLTAAGGTS